MNKSSLFLFILLLFSFSCKEEKKEAKKTASFYYWKQHFKLSPTQKKLLRDLNCKKIHVKYFDIKWDEAINKAVPAAKITFENVPKLNIIPCIFIENQVFKKNKESDLANLTYHLIQEISKKNKISYNEIQFDCDWTKNTREKYFTFLKKIKQKLQKNQIISATIRLHQYKYPNRTGIPPIKKGVLMCYNMGKIEDINSKNSIISPEVLKSYLTGKTPYPIKLDLALPIYKWGLIFRFGKLNHIINDVKDPSSNKNFKSLGGGKFKAITSFYFQETYINKGEVLKVEESTPENISICSKILAKSKHKFGNLVFYHLSHESIKNYNAKFFTKILSIFNQ